MSIWTIFLLIAGGVASVKLLSGYRIENGRPDSKDKH